MRLFTLRRMREAANCLRALSMEQLLKSASNPGLLFAPHVDGAQVAYVGPVNDSQKNELLGHSSALLMPILWEEPFGIVMAEAMACGVPVLGFRRGAVSEVVEHGLTGFLADDVSGLVNAVGRLGEIDRASCRARVERLFSHTSVVDSYLRVYSEMLSARAPTNSRQ